MSNPGLMIQSDPTSVEHEDATVLEGQLWRQPAGKR